MAKTAIELLAEREGKTTLELALDSYQMWYDANQALALNKEYTITNGQNSQRKITRADAQEVKDNLDYWENKVAEAQGESLSAPKISNIFTAGIPSV